MRSKSLLTWLAPLGPLLASAVALPADLSALSATTPSSSQPPQHFTYTPGANGGVLTFNLSHESVNDFLLFSIQVTRPASITTCDDLQITINEKILKPIWTDDKFGHASSPPTRLAVTAEADNARTLRSVSLLSSTFCVHHDRLIEGRTTTTVTTFQVLAIDDVPAVGILPTFSTTFVATPSELDGDLSYPKTSESQSESEKEIPKKLSSLGDLNLEEEIARLYQLDEEFKSLEFLLRGQQALVKNLNKANAIGSGADVRDCDNMSCVLKTLYMKLKSMFIQLRHKIDSGSLRDEDKKEDLSTSTNPMIQNIASVRIPNTGSSSRRSRLRIALTALDIIAIFLSLSCITVFFHSRCCNPRRCAERAAQREERCNRRAYRNLARQQAVRNWWHRRLGRTEDASRSRDYEEKRAMILAQEAVLESAMQEEIRQLRQAEGIMGNSDSETGSTRGGSSGSVRISRTRTHSRPPTYRSRASSGRPPSYKENEAPRQGILAGFPRYTPSGSIVTPSGTDHTPDSSVVSLSPRNSSESLRTEMSAL